MQPSFEELTTPLPSTLRDSFQGDIAWALTSPTTPSSSDVFSFKKKFKKLPPELILYTCYFLPIEDLWRCQRVSNKWHSLLNHEDIWKHAAVRTCKNRVFFSTPQIELSLQEWKRLSKFIEQEVNNVGTENKQTTDIKQMQKLEQELRHQIVSNEQAEMEIIEEEDEEAHLAQAFTGSPNDIIESITDEDMNLLEEVEDGGVYTSQQESALVEGLDEEDDDQWVDDDEEDNNEDDEEDYQIPAITRPTQAPPITDEYSTTLLRNTVVFNAIKASSTDSSSQTIFETRRARGPNLTFWSSTGSKTQDANEHAVFALKKPEQSPEDKSPLSALLIKSVHIKPFMASWQNNNIYSCKTVSLSIGTSEDTFELYTSEELPMKQEASYQEFKLGPILVIQGNDNSSEQTKRMRLMMNHDAAFVIDSSDLVEAFQRFGNTLSPELMQFMHEKMRSKEEKAAASRREAFKGFLFARLNLQGKVQKQPGDEKYYTCLEVADIKGSSFKL